MIASDKDSFNFRVSWAFCNINLCPNGTNINSQKSFPANLEDEIFLCAANHGDYMLFA